MLKFLKNNKTPIGLDLGHGSIKMIQMEQDESGLSVHAADKAVFNPDLNEDQRREFTLRMIREMVDIINTPGLM